MACSKHANYTNLDNFLEDIVEKYRIFSQSDHEVQVVQQLVHEMVNNIVKEAYPPDSGFTVREIILVGSMAEGTRITQPNEFDFMIVLDKFDADHIKALEQNEDGTFCYLKTECKQENCYYYCKVFGNPSDDLSNKSKDCHCSTALKEASYMLHDAGGEMVEEPRFCIAESSLGILLMDGWIDCNGPATKLKFLWIKSGVDEERKTMEISVDLVPVIELEINEFFLDRLDVFHQHYYNKLKAIKKVHIMDERIIRHDMYRVSFAFTEVQLLRDESETHRKCYKLLKYIYRTNDTSIYRAFTSFALKNLVRQHAVCCEGGGLGWCLLKILGDLRDILDKGLEMPIITHIFCTQKDLVLSTGLTPDQDGSVDHDIWAFYKEELSELIGMLEKFRDGSPIPRSSQLRIDIRFIGDHSYLALPIFEYNT